MSGMFSYCEYLFSLLDISKRNTQNVTNMSGIFSYYEYLFSLPDISKWNEYSKCYRYELYFF